MYGTIARMHIKPGMEPRLQQLMEQYPSLNVPGYVGDYVYRMDNEPDVYYLAVMFESRDAYLANANAPDQHQRYLEYRELLAADPEWHDGEIIWPM